MSDGEIPIEGGGIAPTQESVPEGIVLNSHAQVCLQQLLRVWLGFERDLSKVPLLRRIDLGTYTAEDHQIFLRNIRQQVIEGSRWIARTASSFDRDHSEIRSAIISHAVDEHRDYEMLEKDYVASGGQLEDILNMERNIGSEAYTASLCTVRLNQTRLIYSVQCGSSKDSEKRWLIRGLNESKNSPVCPKIQPAS